MPKFHCPYFAYRLHWVESTQGSTIAHGVALGGVTTITTSGTDDDCGELTHDAMWSAAKNCVMEARIKVSAITAVGINVGWVDAVHNTNDQINFELTGVALVDARVTDGAAFVFDTDGTTDVWYCAACDSDTEGTPATFTGSFYGATTAPVANTYANMRVSLNSDGDATFFYNGEAVGFQAECISPLSTDLLTPYVAVIAREGAAKVLTIDRITCWQDE